jgi:hypothetical protein
MQITIRIFNLVYKRTRCTKKKIGSMVQVAKLFMLSVRSICFTCCPFARKDENITLTLIELLQNVMNVKYFLLRGNAA